MAPSNWEVTFFEITSSTPSGNTNTLYANGRMQVPVNITIKAIIDKDPYTLSDEEPDTPGPKLTKEAPSDSPRAESQVKHYWVTTTNVESERIAASIEAPLGIVTTHDENSGFDSYVTLTGTAPVTYYQEDLETDKYDDHADHEIHKWENGKCHLQHVYVSFKNGRLLKSEVTGVNPNSAYKGAVVDWTDGMDIHHAFDMALKTQEVGEWHDKYPDLNWIADVNKKRGKFNLGLCAIRGEVPWGHDFDWSKDNLIILYDRCGNSGRFKGVIDNDWDTGGSRMKDY